MFVRYAVFAGDKEYPKGGWADIKSAGNDLKVINKYLADNKYRWDWWQIIDLKTRTVIIAEDRGTLDKRTRLGYNKNIGD